jgi:outer membrane protein assembly factor BamB
MSVVCRLSSGMFLGVLVAASTAHAQGRGGGAWTTAGADAQRTSALRADAKISVASMQQPGFQFLWKRKFDSPGAPVTALTQPVLLPNIIAYKGFKALAFVGASSDNVYAVDYELNRMFWTQHLATGVPAKGTAACPGGLGSVTKAAVAAPAAAGGRGRGAGAGPAGAPGGAPQGPVMPGGRDGGDNVFAISSGGMVHLMNPQVGTDQAPPVKLLPPNAKVVGSILVGGVMYAATTGKCGGAANGVWAVDLVGQDKTVATFDTGGAGVAGTVAPTIGTDGTVYVATGSGDSPVANAIVSLEPRTLKQRDWFTAPSPFISAPVVFQSRGKDVIVAANKDGRVYLLDSASMGGADHNTPLHKTAAVTASAQDVAGLASWVDSAGTRWVVATIAGPPAPDANFAMNNGAVAGGALAAFTVVETGDVPTLQPQWVSAEIKGALNPAIINGVVFAVSSGEAPAGARTSKSAPAVLYALDGATGKQLWTSGTTITSAARSGPSGGDSQVYVAADDGTLYAFGMPAER